MKFRVTMKDPDTLHEAIKKAVRDELVATTPALRADERSVLSGLREEKTYELCSKWFGYGEYLTVEIDTEAKTCVVVPEK